MGEPEEIDVSGLFGTLVPFKNGKLIRRWATLLKKEHFFYSLGTYKDCDIRIRGYRSVEPYHCRLRYDTGSGVVMIQDCSSVTGTWVNGVAVSLPDGAYLQHNDKIALGPPLLPTSRSASSASRPA
ncbi:unnamed protein product [Peniophora sp. CBMAI 1063]|nr:unnamed protein product [Peniophora sp. CBMAI 1063]